MQPGSIPRRPSENRQIGRSATSALMVPCSLLCPALSKDGALYLAWVPPRGVLRSCDSIGIRNFGGEKPRWERECYLDQEQLHLNRHQLFPNILRWLYRN